MSFTQKPRKLVEYFIVFGRLYTEKKKKRKMFIGMVSICVG